MTDLDYITEAYEEAKKALRHGDVPIGAVVVKNGEIIGRGYNRREQDNDPTAHAEIVALREAGRAIGSWNLTDAILYVTIEPCPMCAGALINAHIKKVIYGANEPKFGAAGTVLNLLQFPSFPHNVRIVGPIDEERCRTLVQDFFQTLRNEA